VRYSGALDAVNLQPVQAVSKLAFHKSEATAMSQEQDRKQNPAEIRNYIPVTAPRPNSEPRPHGVDGNHVPTTDTAPSSPPPKPKK
jgi:hypothetical protein